jgi:cell wall-associated NlpC family hydrolase
MQIIRLFLILIISAYLGGCAGVARSPDDREASTPPPHLTPISAELGREVVLQAMGTLGVRYALGGDSPDSGFDCSGLVAYSFFRAAQQQLPRTTADLSHTGLWIDARDLRAGDLVFFNTLQRPHSHVGIYVGGQRFIHAPTTGGVVRIDSMQGGYWLRRFDGARRVAL